MENENLLPEEEVSTLTLTDENGVDTTFEYLDCIEYEGVEYLVLMPEDDESGELVILEVEPVDEDMENYLAVEDEAVLNAVFAIFKAGFVDAVHGKGGGYRLNRSPEEYTVGSILKLTEGSLSAVSCTSQGAAACSRTECCQAKPMWDKLDKMIDDFFEGITIGDLLKDTME